MKKFAFVPLAAIVALGACSDASQFMAPNDLDLKAASPNTTISGTVSIVAAGTGWERIDGENGSCNPLTGEWTNPAGNTAGAVPRLDKCVLAGAPQVVGVLDGVTATYVQARSGNIHLNFSSCGYTEELNEETGEYEPVLNPCTSPAFIHHHHKRETLEGSGILSVGQWMIALNQVNGWAGPGGLTDADDGRSFNLDAVGPENAMGKAVFSW